MGVELPFNELEEPRGRCVGSWEFASAKIDAGD